MTRAHQISTSTGDEHVAGRPSTVVARAGRRPSHGPAATPAIDATGAHLDDVEEPL